MDSRTTAGDGFGGEPVGEVVEVGGVSLEGADLVGRDAGDVVVGVDIDGGGVGVDDGEQGGINNFARFHGLGLAGVGEWPRAAASREGNRGHAVSPPGSSRRPLTEGSDVTNDGVTASRAKLTCGQKRTKETTAGRLAAASSRIPPTQGEEAPQFTSVGERSKTARKVNLALQRTRPRAAFSPSSLLGGPWPGPLSFGVSPRSRSERLRGAYRHELARGYRIGYTRRCRRVRGDRPASVAFEHVR